MRKARRPAGLRGLGAIVVLWVAALPGCGSGPAAPTPDPCAYTLSSRSQSFPAEGGTGTLTVSTGATCAWAMSGVTGWVTAQSPTSGTGAGTVTFTVAPNADAAARDKILTVATLPFTITQAGRSACSYTISPEQAHFGDEGGSGQVSVTTADGCAWNSASHTAWIAVPAGADQHGSGTLSYSVAANNGTSARSGTLTVAGHTVTVDQGGEAPAPTDCKYSVAPVELTPCMPGGTLAATLTTEQGCAWTVTPGAPWLRVLSSTSATGTGTITISFTDNYDAPRDGVIKVRWPTPSEGQNIRVAQAGCHYAVSTGDIAIAAGGGTGTFDVLQESEPNTCGGPMQDRCVWTAKSSVSWITVTSSMPRTGDQPVAFSVTANTGTTSRIGTISVHDVVVTVTQAGK